MLTAALSGELEKAEFAPHPVFAVGVPKSCPGVPSEVLDARGMWKDKSAYDQAARELALRFQQNFQRFSSATEEIRQAGPKV
jgi:phosphoenolpyruvate carboxykinase (ATP)